jgi:hypothetical protein
VSSTVRDNTPSVTSPIVSFGTGATEIVPRPGLSPTRPLQEAGMRIDPAPSLPWASDSIPAATAAALPPDEPPGVRAVSHGLRVAPNRCGSVTGRMPSSGTLVLPTTIAPASRRRRTTALSIDGTQSPVARMPKVVRMPSVRARMSLMATGTPARGRESPALMASASASARSGTSVTNAFSSASRRSIALRQVSTSSRALTSPARTAAAWSRADLSRISSGMGSSSPHRALLMRARGKIAG